MSGFQPTGIKTRTQRAFRTNTSPSTPRRKTFINRLVEVLELNPQKDGAGDLLVKESTEIGERFYRVKIAKTALERNQKKDAENPAKASQREWSGCYIDDKMAQHISVGAFVTLEMSSYSGPKQKEGEREVNQLETTWIHTAPEKARRCIATADSYNGRVTSYQEYARVTPDLFNEESMNKVVEKLNANIKLYNEGVRVPNIGVRFIASRVIADPKNPEGKKLQFFETSDTIDWISGEEKGTGAPLDSKTFIDLVYQFIDYILGPEDKSSPPLFPEIPEEEIKLTVAVYENYLASQKSQSMIIDDTKQFTATYRMTQTPMRNSQGDDYRLGKNLGATGVLYISDNKYDKKLKTEVERNLATRFFADSIMGNVISFLETEDGLRYTPHSALLPLREDQPSDNSSSSAAAKTDTAPAKEKTESLATPPQTPAAQLSMPSNGVDPFAITEGEDPFNAFENNEEQKVDDDNADSSDTTETEDEHKEEEKTSTRTRRSF